MVYAEFQHLSTGWNGLDYSGPKTNIPMCGSDSVFVCDGRKSLRNQIADASRHAKRLNANLKLGITGLVMHRGPTFTNSKPITDFIPLEADTN